VPWMAQGLASRQMDAPPACPQVVRTGRAELLPLGKPIQRGRRDPLGVAWGRDGATYNDQQLTAALSACSGQDRVRWKALRSRT